MTICEMRQRKTRLDKIRFMIALSYQLNSFYNGLPVLSGCRVGMKKGANRKKESTAQFNVWSSSDARQNKDYVGEATC